ncbi:MAG TPA: Stk1 family PASTA domain-containing Ser/Thr kinase, partial [Micrococcaceae bacterium]
MSSPRVLNGRYELAELLGRGGMADVYLGRDTRLGRTVAVKLLRADLARDPQFQARFRREAQAVAGLNHPSIVAVYDTGEHAVLDQSEDGAHVPYIVMEFVSGRTLRDLIRAKELTTDAAIDYALGVLSALEYSHRAGIVHRDIKPANVMVTGHSSGTGHTVKVMDFGIARAIADSSATMTQTQAVIGTAQYLSPEQARGEAVDARSDLYSAACLLYEMITGRPPFIGDSPVSVAYQHVRETAELPSHFNPDISPALDSVLVRGLQKNRADRFQDAAAFRRALRAARNGVVLTPFSASEAPTDPDATVAVPSMAVRAAGLAAASVGAAGYGAVRDRHDDGQHGGHDDGGSGDASAEPADEPATRALAKVRTGGPLTTGPAPEDDPEALPLGLPRERSVDPEARRRRRAWIVTLFIFLALILAGGGWFGYNLLTAAPPVPVQIKIPDVSRMNETDAITRLFNAGLKPTADHTYDDTIPKGEAVGTDPAGGTSVAPNAAVRLIISNGPATASVPVTANLTEAAARDVVKSAGLVPGTTTLVPDASVGSGMVVSSDPAQGQVVAAGSQVNFNVSNGKVTMPALIGLSKDDATAALAKASSTLVPSFVEKENSVVEPGKVTAQSTEAGQPVDQGSTVTIEIAKAPAAPPPAPTSCPTDSPATGK